MFWPVRWRSVMPRPTCLGILAWEWLAQNTISRANRLFVLVIHGTCIIYRSLGKIWNMHKAWHEVKVKQLKLLDKLQTSQKSIFMILAYLRCMTFHAEVTGHCILISYSNLSTPIVCEKRVQYLLFYFTE